MCVCVCVCVGGCVCVGVCKSGGLRGGGVGWAITNGFDKNVEYEV